MSFCDLQSSTLFRQLQKKIRGLTTPLIYIVLLMFFAFKQSDTPKWAKRIVVGALVYLLNPIDAVPDLSPFLGYTDDLGVLAYALVLIAAHITAEIRTRARSQLSAWVGTPDENHLAGIDQLL